MDHVKVQLAPALYRLKFANIFDSQNWAADTRQIYQRIQ